MTQPASAVDPAEPAVAPGSPEPYGRAGRTERSWWPRAAGVAPRSVLAAAIVAGLVAVVTESPSVGVAGIVTGVAVVAVPATVVVTNGAASRRLIRPLPLLAVVASLALLAVGVFRAAPWLYVLCVLTAVWLLSYAVTAGRRWPAVLLGGGAAWLGLFRGGVWAIGGIRETTRAAKEAVAKPAASDGGESGGDAGSPGHAVPSQLGLPGVISLTVLVLFVFGTLLASADDEFGNMLARLATAPSPDLGGRAVLGVVVTAFALGVAYVTRVPPRLDRVAAAAPQVVRPHEWAIPASALVLLFAAFTAVQFTTLFGGQDHLIGSDGLTYATYARSGFGELVVVTVLTLGVLAAVARWAPRGTPSQRNLLRVIAGAICALTLVIVASALYRMDLYQDAYGLTRLRLVVTTFELWLGLMFVLVLIAGIRLRAAWLPRVVVGTAVAALFGLAALNPDAYIAERNVERFEQTGRIDHLYLDGLSADAVEALAGLPEPERSCSLRRISAELAADEPWTAFNLSRRQARSALADIPVDQDVRCWELVDRTG